VAFQLPASRPNNAFLVHPVIQDAVRYPQKKKKMLLHQL
jgi:hypothetical protein